MGNEAGHRMGRDEVSHERGHETLFFPGCALRIQTPELCQLSFEWLKERGLAQSQSDACCGQPLVYQRKQEAFTKKGERLFQDLNGQGISRIITACPNCFYALDTLRQKEEAFFDILAFPEVLVDEGVVFSSEVFLDAHFTVHDSCPDRQAQVFGSALRALGENLSLVEMKHNREKGLCCGIGDVFYRASRTVQEEQTDRRIGEAENAQATHLLCGCINCALAFHQRIPDVKIVHYLELLFGKGFSVPSCDQLLSSDSEQGVL